MAYTLLQADDSDIGFMADILLDGAMEDHFNQQILHDKQPVLLRKNLHSIVHAGRRLDEALAAQAMILEQDNRRVAFAVMSEMFPGQGGNEIYLFAVAPDSRGQGHGRFLLDSIIERWNGMDLYARCAMKSEGMFGMLCRRGFEHVSTTEDGYRVVHRKKTVV